VTLLLRLGHRATGRTPMQMLTMSLHGQAPVHTPGLTSLYKTLKPRTGVLLGRPMQTLPQATCKFQTALR
jgi:hypothetical protein